MRVQAGVTTRPSDARIILPASKDQFLRATAICTAAFTALLLAMLFSDWLPALDTTLSGLLQSARSEPLDDLMVCITMLGDTRATLGAMTALLLLLACARRWWLLVHLAAIFLASRLAVPILKLTLARERPSAVYGGLESFSFPSGHAAAAMTLFGVICLITIRNLPARRARWLMVLTGIVILGVAVSRVYLLAHWPSDVIASLALGTPFVLAFGWQLQLHPISSPWFTPATLVMMILISAAHIWSAFPLEAARYFA